MNAKSPGEEAAAHNNLVVQVRYLAAGQPYVEPHADGAEFVASLKPRVLQHFGLVEGDVDGGRKAYAMSVDGQILTDLQVTLSSVANGKHRVLFTLLEQFIQG